MIMDISVSEFQTFNSRPHKEVDMDKLERQLMEGPFNSRPHKEVDGHSRSAPEMGEPFNSRPHKEVDQNYRYPFDQSHLSIHDLTRRSTDDVISIHPLSCLSIHDLTRRSTTQLSPLPFPRSFQFTTSQGGRLQFLFRSDSYARSFNSRPHKEVDTLVSKINAGYIRFQFTTSQGGRRYICK